MDLKAELDKVFKEAMRISKDNNSSEVCYLAALVAKLALLLGYHLGEK